MDPFFHPEQAGSVPLAGAGAAAASATPTPRGRGVFEPAVSPRRSPPRVVVAGAAPHARALG